MNIHAIHMHNHQKKIKNRGSQQECKGEQLIIGSFNS